MHFRISNFYRTRNSNAVEQINVVCLFVCLVLTSRPLLDAPCETQVVWPCQPICRDPLACTGVNRRTAALKSTRRATSDYLGSLDYYSSLHSWHSCLLHDGTAVTVGNQCVHGPFVDMETWNRILSYLHIETACLDPAAFYFWTFYWLGSTHAVRKRP